MATTCARCGALLFSDPVSCGRCGADLHPLPPPGAPSQAGWQPQPGMAPPAPPAAAPAVGGAWPPAPSAPAPIAYPPSTLPSPPYGGLYPPQPGGAAPPPGWPQPGQPWSAGQPWPPPPPAPPAPPRGRAGMVATVAVCAVVLAGTAIGAVAITRHGDTAPASARTQASPSSSARADAVASPAADEQSTSTSSSTARSTAASGGGLTVPPAIHGIPRATNSTLLQEEQTLTGQLTSLGVDGVIAFYQDPVRAEVLYTGVVRNSGSGSSAFQTSFLDGFKRGMESQGAVFGSPTSTVRNGITFSCQSGTMKSLPVGLCTWTDRVGAGFAADLGSGASKDRALTLATDARSSIEG